MHQSKPEGKYNLKNIKDSCKIMIKFIKEQKALQIPIKM